MKKLKLTPLAAAVLVAALGLPGTAMAAAFVQCPEDADGNGIPYADVDGNLIPGSNDSVDIPNLHCLHFTAGDGFAQMADGREMYMFGFSDVTTELESNVLLNGIFRTTQPAPPIVTREGDELYLTITNVGTTIRPDLFDPHTLHYHGFPNASAIFDGLPESAISVGQQASLTYYYNNREPGTYMYHCHVEATEHMQMGMLGSLYVRPLQNQTGYAGPTTVAQLDGGNVTGPTGYVYNDGDGSTAYDVEYPIQLQGYDHVFHKASFETQPLPFALMVDTYPSINGRNYPDTVAGATIAGGAPNAPSGSNPGGSQQVSSLITATAGERVLLRVHNLGVVRQYTITTLGLPMKVVGHGARLLRGAGQAVGQNRFIDTNSLTLGGGESADILIDTTGISPGTYFLYATNMNLLSNNAEDTGGMMTEIVIN